MSSVVYNFIYNIFALYKEQYKIKPYTFMDLDVFIEVCLILNWPHQLEKENVKSNNTLETDLEIEIYQDTSLGML